MAIIYVGYSHRCRVMAPISPAQSATTLAMREMLDNPSGRSKIPDNSSAAQDSYEHQPADGKDLLPTIEQIHGQAVSTSSCPSGFPRRRRGVRRVSRLPRDLRIKRVPRHGHRIENSNPRRIRKVKPPSTCARVQTCVCKPSTAAAALHRQRTLHRRTHPPEIAE